MTLRKHYTADELYDMPIGVTIGPDLDGDMLTKGDDGLWRTRKFKKHPNRAFSDTEIAGIVPARTPTLDRGAGMSAPNTPREMSPDELERGQVFAFIHTDPETGRRVVQSGIVDRPPGAGFLGGLNAFQGDNTESSVFSMTPEADGPRVWFLLAEAEEE